LKRDLRTKNKGGDIRKKEKKRTKCLDHFRQFNGEKTSHLLNWGMGWGVGQKKERLSGGTKLCALSEIEREKK